MTFEWPEYSEYKTNSSPITTQNRLMQCSFSEGSSLITRRQHPSKGGVLRQPAPAVTGTNSRADWWFITLLCDLTKKAYVHCMSLLCDSLHIDNNNNVIKAKKKKRLINFYVGRIKKNHNPYWSISSYFPICISYILCRYLFDHLRNNIVDLFGRSHSVRCPVPRVRGQLIRETLRGVCVRRVRRLLQAVREMRAHI